MKRRLGMVLVGGFLCLGGAQAWAACVICASDGQCFDQPSTFSGNCECSITAKFGSKICKPKGVCDPNDLSTCPDTGPGPLVAANGAPVFDTRFLDLTAAKDAPLASALWGAMDQERDAQGLFVQTHFVPGVHTGTMGTRDHKSFKYTVEARQLDPTVFLLRVTLEEERTGEVRRYEGSLFNSGLHGELARISDDGSPSTVAVWDLRQKPDQGGKDPRSSQ